MVRSNLCDLLLCLCLCQHRAARAVLTVEPREALARSRFVIATTVHATLNVALVTRPSAVDAIAVRLIRNRHWVVRARAAPQRAVRAPVLRELRLSRADAHCPRGRVADAAVHYVRIPRASGVGRRRTIRRRGADRHRVRHRRRLLHRDARAVAAAIDTARRGRARLTLARVAREAAEALARPRRAIAGPHIAALCEDAVRQRRGQRC